MQLRRSLALVSGALLLTAPLGACGFDPATDRINTITVGTSDRDTTVDILNAVIVSADEGSGTFIATLVNNDTEEEATLESLEPVEEGVGNDPDRVESFPGFSPVTIEADGLVNLAQDDQGIAVQGEFRAGDVVTVDATLSGGQVVRLNIPVVWNCQEFEGIDGEGGDCEVAEAEEH